MPARSPCSPRRCSRPPAPAALNILGREFAGVLVADCFMAYDAAALQERLHQKCLAYLLRELPEFARIKLGAVQVWMLDVMARWREALALKSSAPGVRVRTYEAATGLEERLVQLISGAVRRRDLDRARLGRRLERQRVESL